MRNAKPSTIVTTAMILHHDDKLSSEDVCAAAMDLSHTYFAKLPLAGIERFAASPSSSAQFKRLRE
jgi:hypothetical protein